MGYKLKRATMRVNGVEKQIRPAGRLPSAYKEVEWIESSGTQYIDTGMQFTNNTTVSLDVNITTAPSGWTGVVGAQKNNVDTSWAIGVNTNAGTYQHGYAYGDWNSGPLLNQRVIYSNDATHLYIDGTSVKTISDGGTFTTPVNGTIFKVNYQNGTGFPYLLSAKLYNCKIYESGTLVRDLVPCYRKADGVIGMYDIVNDQFYTNSGTGTFTKGPDKQVRPSGWQPGENTLFYAPLTGDVSTQGSYTVTLNTNIGSSFSTTSAGKTYLQQTNGRILFAGSTVFPQTRTVNYWFYPVDTLGATFGVCIGGIVIGSHAWSTYTGVRSGKSLHDVYGNREYAIFGNDSSIMNRWNMLTITWEPSQMIGYLNGVQIGTKSTSNTLRDSDYIVIGSNDAYCNQKISEIIMEGVVRTAQEVVDYYDQTKANYGL